VRHAWCKDLEGGKGGGEDWTYIRGEEGILLDVSAFQRYGLIEIGVDLNLILFLATFAALTGALTAGLTTGLTAGTSNSGIEDTDATVRESAGAEGRGRGCETDGSLEAGGGSEERESHDCLFVLGRWEGRESR
jgi:hypothetical protein